jgi:hypothetical protein
LLPTGGGDPQPSHHAEEHKNCLLLEGSMRNKREPPSHCTPGCGCKDGGMLGPTPADHLCVLEVGLAEASL